MKYCAYKKAQANADADAIDRICTKNNISPSHSVGKIIITITYSNVPKFSEREVWGAVWYVSKLCLISVRTWLIVYCAKTGSPFQKYLVVKNFSKM